MVNFLIGIANFFGVGSFLITAAVLLITRKVRAEQERQEQLSRQTVQKIEVVANRLSEVMRALARAQVKEKMASITYNGQKIVKGIADSSEVIELDCHAVFEIDMMKEVEGDAELHNLISHSLSSALHDAGHTTEATESVGRLRNLLQVQADCLRENGLPRLAQAYNRAISAHSDASEATVATSDSPNGS